MALTEPMSKPLSNITTKPSQIVFFMMRPNYMINREAAESKTTILTAFIYTKAITVPANIMKRG